MNEREKMLSGELYRADDPELTRLRARARELTRRFNETGDQAVLRELLGRVGENVWIEPPFFCDYGENIALGDGAYLNTGCVVLDCAAVEIGPRALLGPAVQIYAATHPTEAAVRREGLELARLVTIGEDAWIGGAAVLGPGVTVGARSTVGAGSVVVGDVPADVVAVGNPCRVVRSLA